MTEPARLTIARSSSYADGIRAYRLAVNGEVLHKLGKSEVIELEIPPGEVELVGRADWCRSNIERFTLAPGERRAYELNNTMHLRGHMALALLYITIWWSSYLTLTELPRVEVEGSEEVICGRCGDAVEHAVMARGAPACERCLISVLEATPAKP